MLSGTSLMSCERFCAVTMTSASSPLGGEAATSWAGTDELPSHKKAVPRATTPSVITLIVLRICPPRSRGDLTSLNWKCSLNERCCVLLAVIRLYDRHKNNCQRSVHIMTLELNPTIAATVPAVGAADWTPY